MAFLCVSQQGEFKITIKNFWGKSMSKKNVRSQKQMGFFSPVVFCFFPSNLFYRILAVSLHDGAQKHHKNMC
jgi:hypothetical protein